MCTDVVAASVPAEYRSQAALCPAEEVTIGDKIVLGVDARRLHKWLEVDRHFRSWAPDRIASLKGKQGEDWDFFDRPNLGDQSGRGGDRRSKDYVFSLHFAMNVGLAETNGTIPHPAPPPRSKSGHF